MLSFDIRSLDSRAETVDGRLAPDDPVWQEADVRPGEPLRVTGRLSNAGAGRYYFSGRLEGGFDAECRRCLTDVRSSVADEVHALFAEEDEQSADDPDVFPIDPRSHALDLRPAVREQWLLSVPQFVQCREDCKGLCPTCGADLNAGTCDCPPATDSRWAALRAARDE
jgi:uncharacterized protein